MFSIDMLVKYADLFYYICVSMGVIVNLTMSFLHGRSIDRLEKNTDGMKDALMRVTGEKEFAKGVKVATDAAQAASPTISVKSD